MEDEFPVRPMFVEEGVHNLAGLTPTESVERVATLHERTTSRIPSARLERGRCKVRFPLPSFSPVLAFILGAARCRWKIESANALVEDKKYEVPRS